MRHVLLIMQLLATPHLASANSTTYRLRPDKCSFVAHLLKGGIASALAHDHVVVARRLSGTIRYDAAYPQRSSIHISVDARSLDPDPPALRRRYGMKETLEQHKRDEIRQNLHAKNQLWTRKYPQLSFVSTSVRELRSGVFRVRGELTLRGVRREIAFKTQVTASDRWLRASAQLRIKQSDFGYAPYRAALGAIKVQDRVTLDLYLEGQSQ